VDQIKTSKKRRKQSKGSRSGSVKSKRTDDYTKFSPIWVVVHAKKSPSHFLLLIDHIRQGVKKTEWRELISYIGATEKELAAILPTSISSLQKKDVYDKETSERIYELAKLYGLGYAVFDTKDDFKNWLQAPSRALGGQRPFDLLDSSLGFELVENEITRIQYNVYT